MKNGSKLRAGFLQSGFLQWAEIGFQTWDQLVRADLYAVLIDPQHFVKAGNSSKFLPIWFLISYGSIPRMGLNRSKSASG